MRGFSSLSALVVDDNRHMRILALSLLRGFGFKHIREAGDVEAAWTIMRAKPADIVLLDLDLPGDNGSVLIERIRRDPASFISDAAIIVMTAFTDRPRLFGARDAGASEIVAKPLSAKSLLDRIVAVIDHPRPFVHGPAYVGPDRRRRTHPEFCGPHRRRSDEVDVDDPTLVAARQQ